MTKCFWLFVQNYKLQLFYIFQYLSKNVNSMHLQYRAKRKARKKHCQMNYINLKKTSLLSHFGNGPSQTRVSLSQYTSSIEEKQPGLHWQWRTSAPDWLASSSSAKGTVFSVVVIGHTSVNHYIRKISTITYVKVK